MKVHATTPLLIIAAVFTSFSFPTTINATGGSGSSSSSSSISDPAGGKLPVFLKFNSRINGHDSALLNLQKDNSKETVKRLVGKFAFLVREAWVARLDFATLGGDIDNVDVDTSESADVEDQEGADAGLRTYDIINASFSGGPRDTPFRWCSLYGEGDMWSTKGYQRNEVISAKGAAGIECFAIYFRGYPVRDVWK